MSWDERPYADDSRDGWAARTRFGENPLGWSLSLGRVAGINVRVHFIFLLYVAVELLLAGSAFLYQARLLLILFGSVFLHELGHCFAARAVGGSAREILMWPLGGLAYVDAPMTPQAQFITTICGPLVNVLICAAAAPALILSTGVPGIIPWNPFRSGAGAYLHAEWQVWLYLVFLVNYSLFLFNMLLVIYPFDAGRIVQAALWPALGYQRSMHVSATVGMVGAVALGLFGLLRNNFLYVGIAVFGYVTCLNTRRMVSAGAYDGTGIFSGDDRAGWGRDDDGPAGHPARRRGLGGLYARWRQRQALKRETAERERLRRLDREVDRILTKVHQEGIQSLTRAERATLDTATRRRRREEQRSL